MRPRDRGVEETDFWQDTFGRIEFISTDNNLLSFVQSSERINLRTDSRHVPIERAPSQWSVSSGKERDERINRNVVEINADGTMRDSRDTALRIDTSTTRLVSHNSNARREEMSSVGMSLESDQIAAEHSRENLLSSYWVEASDFSIAGDGRREKLTR